MPQEKAPKFQKPDWFATAPAVRFHAFVYAYNLLVKCCRRFRRSRITRSLSPKSSAVSGERSIEAFGFRQTPGVDLAEIHGLCVGDGLERYDFGRFSLVLSLLKRKYRQNRSCVTALPVTHARDALLQQHQLLQITLLTGLKPVKIHTAGEAGCIKLYPVKLSRLGDAVEQCGDFLA